MLCDFDLSPRAFDAVYSCQQIVKIDVGLAELLCTADDLSDLLVRPKHTHGCIHSHLYTSPPLTVDTGQIYFVVPAASVSYKNAKNHRHQQTNAQNCMTPKRTLTCN